jgi:hypothetical protein
MNGTTIGRLFVALLLLSGVLGCSRHPKVTVLNKSGVTIQNVVISGSGFSEKLGDIKPGFSASTAVHPTADSGLRVSFEANGKRHDQPEAGYMEASPHYRIIATVAPDFSVTLKNETGAK